MGEETSEVFAPTKAPITISHLNQVVKRISAQDLRHHLPVKGETLVQVMSVRFGNDDLKYNQKGSSPSRGKGLCFAHPPISDIVRP